MPVQTSEDSTNTILSVRGLTKHFRVGSGRTLTAYAGVSFDVDRGSTFGIVGESGSGKTTLARSIIRLQEPSAGRIVFDGVELLELSPRQLRLMRRQMQIVHQEPEDALNPSMTIGMQITEGLRIYEGTPKSVRRERAVELLRSVGLPPSVAAMRARMLSIGMQQRACIARAIALEPRLLILDEPTSALPPETEQEVIQLLSGLQARLGMSYVFISHDLALVRRSCDHVAVMYLGQIVEMAKTTQLFEEARHPYTRALLSAMLKGDPSDRGAWASRREQLGGEIPSPIDLPTGCYLASRCPFVEQRCREQPQELLPVGNKSHLVRCWRAASADLGPALRPTSSHVIKLQARP